MTMLQLLVLAIVVVLLLTLPAVLRDLHSEILKVPPRLYRVARQLLFRSGAILSPENNSAGAIVQSAGAFLLLIAAAIFLRCSWVLLVVTLAPLGSATVAATDIQHMAAWLGGTIILLAVVFGAAITDLWGLTNLTCFGRAKRPSPWHLLGLQVAFVSSIGIGVALAASRGLTIATPADKLHLVTATLNQIHFWSLCLIEALLPIGLAVCIASLDVLFTRVAGLVLVVTAAVVGVVGLVFAVLRLIVALLLRSFERAGNTSVGSYGKAVERCLRRQLRSSSENQRLPVR